MNELFTRANASSEEQVVEVAPARLSSAALDALVEEFIHREGTDYGLHEASLADKKAQIMEQLRTGEVKIYFDLQRASCNLVPRR